MSLKMGTFARVVFGVACTLSSIAPFVVDAANLKNQSKPILGQSVKPCDSKSFHLSIQVEPAQGANAQNRLGLVVDGGSKSNRVRRTHVEQESEFSLKECKRWQERSIQWLVQAGIESNSPERKAVSCINLANVDLVIDGNTKKYKFCLADSKKDAVSFAFQKFYNGTDALVKK